jgi:hypothetical protein
VLDREQLRGSGLLDRKGTVDVAFDLTEYRKLASRADRFCVATVIGTRKVAETKGAWPLPYLLVSPSIPSVGYNILLRAHKPHFDALVQSMGKKFLFFLNEGNGGRLLALAYFPWEGEREQVVAWLKGRAKQHTLFDPAGADELPDGIRASFYAWDHGNRGEMTVTLTNTGSRSLLLEKGCVVGMSFVRSDGAHVPRLFCGADGHPFVRRPPREFVALEPGDSTRLPAFDFILRPSGAEVFPGGQRSLGLRPGTYHCRFVYDSTDREPVPGAEPLRVRIVVHGSFAVDPAE